MAKYVLGEGAARKLRAMMNGAMRSGRIDGAASAEAFDSTFPLPFEVQWASSANSGSGSWVIWLPGNSLVTADGEALDPSEDLTAAGGDYPSGWYSLGDKLDADAGGTLYLIVKKVEDEETGEESLKATFDSEASEEEGAYSIVICTATVNSSTGARSVRQFVTSAIVTGGKCVKSIVGDATSSEAVSGEVEISGQLEHGVATTSCGITFKTIPASEDEETGEETPARIVADLKNRLASETDWGVHEIKFTNASGQRKYAHFLGCEDVEIKGAVDVVAVDAITGISFSIESGKLKATLTKTNTGTGAVSTSTVDLLTLVGATVVKSSEYTSDQKLVNTLTTLSVLAEATPSPSTTDVFETTPHSEES